MEFTVSLETKRALEDVLLQAWKKLESTEIIELLRIVNDFTIPSYKFPKDSDNVIRCIVGIAKHFIYELQKASRTIDAYRGYVAELSMLLIKYKLQVEENENNEKTEQNVGIV